MKRETIELFETCGEDDSIRITIAKASDPAGKLMSGSIIKEEVYSFLDGDEGEQVFSSEKIDEPDYVEVATKLVKVSDGIAITISVGSLLQTSTLPTDMFRHHVQNAPTMIALAKLVSPAG